MRLPAHFCGLAALKPTAGRVPIDGVIDDLGPFGPLRDPRTQIGILAPPVADVALVLSVIADRPGARACASELAGRRVAGRRRARAARRRHPRVVARGRRGAADAGAGRGRRPRGGHALTEAIWESYGAEAITYDLLGRWDAYRADGGASASGST